jgi:serine/threonine-protein phosphatase PP1 catalytic subunit
VEDLIEKSFMKELIGNPKRLSDLGFKEVLTILSSAKEAFENEYLLLEFNFPNLKKDIYVIGDIHGNLETLVELFYIIERNNPKIVIFLGDIVDRGPKQLECLLFVLILKLLEPHRYYLLRGNHETLEMNQYYGFNQEFINRFKDPHKFGEILAVYNSLPLCAIVNSRILCLHGGVPQDKQILQKIRGVRTTNLSNIFELIAQSFIQIMWNDPKKGMQGFSESFRGPGIKFFGEDVFNKFLEVNNLKLLIRAHECFPEGYRWFFHKRLLSIFSSANYRGGFSPNPASYAVINKKEIIPKLLKLKNR